MPSCCQLVASQKLHDLRLFAKLQGSSKLILFFTCFPSIFSTDFHASLSLSCSHKMFALFGAFCLLLLQATLTPAQVSLAKLRARITCLHFQKVDRPKPPPPLSACSRPPFAGQFFWSLGSFCLRNIANISIIALVLS